MTGPSLDDLRPARALVSEAEVDAALHRLQAGVEPIARARGRMLRAEAMLKHLRALLLVRSEARSFQAREAEALADPRYAAAIEEHAEAAAAYELERARRNADELTIEVWRTASANQRQVRL